MNEDGTGSGREERDTGAAGEDDSPGGNSSITRRRLVATGAATWASVSLAGCDRVDDPGVDTPETETTTVPTGDGQDTPTDDGTGNTTVSTQTTTTDAPETQTEAPPTTTSCASIGRFASGMEVGLHVDVYDSATGEYLGDERVDAVTVEFPDADYGPVELSWTGPHERYSADGWGGKIDTSEDAQPGTYRYEITIEGADVADDSETVTDQFTIV